MTEVFREGSRGPAGVEEARVGAWGVPGTPGRGEPRTKPAGTGGAEAIRSAGRYAAIKQIRGELTAASVFRQVEGISSGQTGLSGHEAPGILVLPASQMLQLLRGEGEEAKPLIDFIPRENAFVEFMQVVFELFAAMTLALLRGVQKKEEDEPNTTGEQAAAKERYSHVLTQYRPGAS